AALIAQIREADIPLNVFRSKSGGAHLILILSDFLPASQVVSTLKSWCALLKLGKVEIFPKQTQLKVEDGDLGNWLNMPYFGDTRPLLDDKAQPVSVNNFPSTVKVVDPKELKEHKLKLEDSIIKDGPPCLQTLSLSGFPEGSRNNGLFNLGIYAKRVYPNNNDWKNKLAELNKELMKPPLDMAEVHLIVAQLEKIDYKYKCHDQPINMYCNATVCRGRKYGIGDGALPIITGATKLFNQNGGSEWWITINGQRVSVTAEEL